MSAIIQQSGTIFRDFTKAERNRATGRTRSEEIIKGKTPLKQLPSTGARGKRIPDLQKIIRETFQSYRRPRYGPQDENPEKNYRRG